MMNENKDLIGTNETCPAVGYQALSICVPITITPFAKPGTTVTKCCGNPVVKSGRVPCEGEKNGACYFTISQDICVEVPIDFGATAQEGDTYVNCKGASADDICTECSKHIPAPAPQSAPKAEAISTTEA
ncbi:MAG: hypothetical protein RSB05_03355 [Clostridiales bacterium]